MAASAQTPLWKRVVILLSGVVAAAVVRFALGPAGVPWALAIVIALVAGFVALWVAAALLHVRLKRRGWE